MQQFGPPFDRFWPPLLDAVPHGATYPRGRQASNRAVRDDPQPLLEGYILGKCTQMSPDRLDRVGPVPTFMIPSKQFAALANLTGRLRAY